MICVAKDVRPLLGNFESQAKKQQQSSKKLAADINDQAPQFKEVEEKSFFQKYW